MASARLSSAEGAKVLDGRAVAARVTDRVGEETVRLKQEARVIPGLAVVLVGDDPASQVYVGAKARKAEELGFHSVQHTLPATTREPELLGLVEALNRDPAIHGILVQFPLPAGLDRSKVIAAITRQGRRRASSGECRAACDRHRHADRAVHAGRLHAADPRSAGRRPRRARARW